MKVVLNCTVNGQVLYNPPKETVQNLFLVPVKVDSAKIESIGLEQVVDEHTSNEALMRDIQMLEYRNGVLPIIRGFRIRATYHISLESLQTRKFPNRIRPEVIEVVSNDSSENILAEYYN